MTSKSFTLYSTTKRQITDEVGKCEKCGDKKSLEVHHITKVSEGGGHTPSNLIVLCHTCHKDKAHRGSLSSTEQRKIVRNRSRRLKDAIKVILDKAKERQRPKNEKPTTKKGEKRKTKSPFDDFYKPPIYKPPVYRPPKLRI